MIQHAADAPHPQRSHPQKCQRRPAPPRCAFPAIPAAPQRQTTILNARLRIRRRSTNPWLPAARSAYRGSVFRFRDRLPVQSGCSFPAGSAASSPATAPSAPRFNPAVVNGADHARYVADQVTDRVDLGLPVVGRRFRIYGVHERFLILHIHHKPTCQQAGLLYKPCAGKA